MNVKPYLKAIVAGLVAALSFAAPLVDAPIAPSGVLGIILAFIVAFLAVYATKNTPAVPETTIVTPTS